MVHLQCPLCAAVLQHYCAGRVQLDDEDVPAAHAHGLHHSHSPAATADEKKDDGDEVIHAAALEADEESLREGGAWEMDPVMAKRFRATATKRARRKRERETEEKCEN